MRIQVLGTGCARCKSLVENVQAAVAALGVAAQIEKVEKIEEIMKFGVMSTPALVVDGVVKSSGKLLSVDEVKGLIGGS